jgi:hypothetical protein
MPRDDQHHQKARQNEQFATTINRSTVVAEEWAIIITFYSALHYVQRYFAKCGAGDCDNHQKREEEIKRDDKLRPILPQYKFLYKLGHMSRYKCFALPSNKPYEQAQSALAVIKAQVDKALSE